MKRHTRSLLKDTLSIKNLVIIGLIFLGSSGLEDWVLARLYQVRGVRDPSPRLYVVEVDNEYTPQEVLDRVPHAQHLYCFNFHDIPTGGDQCFDIKYDLGEHRRDVSKVSDWTHQKLANEKVMADFNSVSDILFLGNIGAFNPVPTIRVIGNEYGHGEGKDILVLVPPSGSEIRNTTTPIGNLSETEFNLNVLSNILEQTRLKKLPGWGKILFNAFWMLLALFLLGRFPILLAAFFLSLSALLNFIIALLCFDYLHLHLPVFSVVTVLAGVLLVHSIVRVHRLQKNEWDLERYKDSVKKLEEVRTNFLSLVSHDLKTPIARMRSIMEQLKRGDFGALKPDQDACVSRLLAANDSLTKTITTFLMLNRVESGGLLFRYEPVDLLEITQQVIQGLKNHLNDKEIKVELLTEPLFLIEADRALVQEVLYNLMDNALKYSPRGGTLYVSTGEEANCQALTPPRPAVWFEVLDQGPGIPVLERENIFKKFFKGTAPLPGPNQNTQGTGVGLHLSEYFVLKHGGVVKFLTKVQGEPLIEVGPSWKADLTQGLYKQLQQQESGTLMRVILPVERSKEHEVSTESLTNIQ